ncbi:MAG TPA: ATP-binding protein [Candidatus Competibacteraceae bacterium]|nr:ATP-binding protein [Candidatus Competibacteraceae bacterium]
MATNGTDLADSRRGFDADAGQAMARLGVAGLGLGDLLALAFSGYAPAPAYLLPLALWLGYALFATLWLVVVLVAPGAFPSRRLIGLSVDLAVPSALLHLAPALMAPLYLVYLWVALDYGWRYGTPYFLVSLTGATGAFGAVIVTTPFWDSPPGFAWGWLLGLMAFPSYVASWLGSLRASQRRAERATARKSEFLAHLSHELRTPLHTILGVCHLLPDPGPDAVQRRYLHLLRKTGEELEKEVTQALHWFRLEAGGVVRVDEPFDLYRAVTDSVHQLLPQAEAQRLELRLVIDPAVPCWVEGDAHRLHQVLTNLLANAVKFTAAGGVQVGVRLLRRHGATATVGIGVRDTGSGIADAARASLLEPYRQANPDVERRYGGAGLGTAIVRKTVELLGGEVWFQSVPPQGTAFWLRLPLGVQAPAEGAHRPRPPAAVLGRVAVWAVMRDPAAPWLARLRQRVGDRLTVVAFDADGDAGAAADASPAPLPATGLVIVQAVPGCAARLARLRARAPGHPLGWLVVAEEAPPPEPLGVPVVASHDADALERALYAQALWEDSDGSLAAAVPAPHRSGRLLVAEDNLPHQWILRTLLEQAGYQVDLCSDGHVALERLQTTPYDGIILDAQMPRLDGLETLRRYRATCAHPAPVVMVSADAAADTVRRSHAAGARYYLTKPILPDVLLRTLALALGHPSAAQTHWMDSSEPNRPVIPHPPGLFDALADSFIRSSIYDLEDLRHAVATHDADAYRRAVHGLLNSALAVHADDLAHLCVRAQAAVAQDFSTQAPAWASTLRDACETTQEALRTARRSPAGAG